MIDFPYVSLIPHLAPSIEPSDKLHLLRTNQNAAISLLTQKTKLRPKLELAKGVINNY